MDQVQLVFRLRYFFGLHRTNRESRGGRVPPAALGRVSRCVCRMAGSGDGAGGEGGEGGLSAKISIFRLRVFSIIQSLATLFVRQQHEQDAARAGSLASRTAEQQTDARAHRGLGPGPRIRPVRFVQARETGSNSWRSSRKTARARARARVGVAPDRAEGIAAVRAHLDPSWRRHGLRQRQLASVGERD